MDLADFFIRKPQVDPNERPARRADKAMTSDWAWALMILGIAGVLAYSVHTDIDSHYPAGRAPVYCWITFGAVLFAPLLLLPHFFGQRRAKAVFSAMGFTLCWLGPVLAAGWPASERLIYEPLSPKTWTAITARVPATLWVWFTICAPFAIGCCISAVLSFTRHRALRANGRWQMENGKAGEPPVR